MTEDRWPAIAVLGAGAVGCYFGGLLARAGASVTLIGRPQHVEAITRDGLFLESLHFGQRIPVSASTDVAAVRGAQVVLLCVKTPDTEEAARSLAPHLAGGTVVVSLQNGVDNAERFRSAVGIEALPAGRQRDDRCRRQLEDLASVFARAGVPCLVSDNIEADLWTKLIMNCAYNAISALSRARYGRIVRTPWTRDVMRQVTDEAIAVARASGVRFPDGDLVESVFKLGEAMAGALSSTAQDIGRGKRTEIDSLNGYVARRGAELGIATPVNQTLHALVKLLEEPAAEAVPPRSAAADPTGS